MRQKQLDEIMKRQDKTDQVMSLITQLMKSFVKNGGKKEAADEVQDMVGAFLDSEKELEPWVGKVNEIAKQVKKLRIYFNNHYAGAAIINAMQFEEMHGQELSDDKKQVLQQAEHFYSKHVPPKNQVA